MGIPKYPDFISLDMKHREDIEEWLANYPPVISEHTFTNLFIWKGRGGYEISIYKGFLIIVMSPRDRRDFVMPPVGEELVDHVPESVKVLLENRLVEDDAILLHRLMVANQCGLQVEQHIGIGQILK